MTNDRTCVLVRAYALCSGHVPASHREQTLTAPIHHDEQACCTRSSPVHIKEDHLLCTGDTWRPHPQCARSSRGTAIVITAIYRVLLKCMDIWDTSSTHNDERECQYRHVSGNINLLAISADTSSSLLARIVAVW
jgi:hypothetical protein